MSLKDQFAQDLKEAMRARDPERLRTIRSIRAALQAREIELREGGVADLKDDEVLAVVQKQAKLRRDAIEQFEAAGRDDLVAHERAELTIIEEYLPSQLDDDAIRNAVRAIIAESGASSMRDIGKVMGPAMAQLRGKADGRRVNAIVRELLD